MARARRPPARKPVGDEPEPPPGQVGKRPSRPGFLATIGVMWIVAGGIELFALDASWRLVPAVVFIGIGLFFLRGAATTVVRRTDGNGSREVSLDRVNDRAAATGDAHGGGAGTTRIPAPRILFLSRG